jgi:hypothetical protein
MMVEMDIMAVWVRVRLRKKRRADRIFDRLQVRIL